MRAESVMIPCTFNSVLETHSTLLTVTELPNETTESPVQEVLTPRIVAVNSFPCRKSSVATEINFEYDEAAEIATTSFPYAFSPPIATLTS